MGTDGSGNRAILVIDDSPDNRALIVDILGDEGYRVVTAEHGAVALEMLAELRPSLILLDMWMPVMDGWQFVSTYRASPGPHAPIVMMTAVTEAQVRAHELSADGVLAKPFGIEELIELVERFVLRDPTPHQNR